MAADKITYSDKVGVTPKETHINQVWDDDMNEIKLKVNNNADLFDGLETEVDANTLDIIDLENRTANVTTSHPILVPFDFPINNNTDLNSIHGSLLINNSEDGIILNSVTPIVGNGGVSKVMAVVLAGTDLVGNITITGTSIDRNTGVETPADTEIMAINGLSVNNSTVDANGNNVYSYTGGYLSSKWWKGTLTFSTTDLDLTEIRFAQLSFEQFNDSPGITLNSLDATYITTNVNAQMDCYLYTVKVTGDKVDVSMVAELHHETGLFANNSYRRRKGNLADLLNGTTDGIFIDLYLNPLNQPYFNSFSCKLWATKEETINVNFI
jgi:hypothetical protein